MRRGSSAHSYIHSYFRKICVLRLKWLFFSGFLWFKMIQLENEQQKIIMVLTMRKKEFEVIDIMKPGNQVSMWFVEKKSNFCLFNQNHRTYMRDRGKKKDGQRNVLPPQIFNGDDYIGVSPRHSKRGNASLLIHINMMKRIRKWINRYLSHHILLFTLL